MTRYRLLRNIGCDWLTAAVIVGLNNLAGVPDGLIKFMTLEIEYDA